MSEKKQPTVADLLYEVECEFCNNYCKVPDNYPEEQDIPYKECDECPLHLIGI